MMRRVCSVFFYVMAGAFFASAMALPSSAAPSSAPGSTPAIIGVSTVFGVLCLAIGLDLSRYAHWQRDAAFVLVGSALLAILWLVQMACMMATPEVSEVLPEGTVDRFRSGDHVSGILCIAAFLGLGCLLIWCARNKPPANNM
ncbi:MAG: hypothetical protein D6725_14195 [Planctomycetota bacterium]|nr:MAG: hypothetical protein D6725_14195 [Planctomycetota bacterium]